MQHLFRPQRIKIVLKIVFLIIIGGCIIFYFVARSPKGEGVASLNFSDATSEEVFHRYLLESGSSIPLGVGQIQGVEGTMFGYMGPAYIRFQATDEFIDGIIEEGYVEPFFEIPCSDFVEISSKYFVNDYPEKLEWWRPTTGITSSVCYRAQGGQYDDAKYLLVSGEDETVYFYRTPTCGLCPD